MVHRATAALIGIITFFLVGDGIWCSVRTPSSDTPRKVFIVHSYNEIDPCGMPQHEGLLSALAKAGYIVGTNLELHLFFMDTKGTSYSPEALQTRGRAAIESIEHINPDVLVTLDDDAFRTVGLHFVNSTIPVVFSGVNGSLENYNATTPFMERWDAPGGNVTGVYEHLYLREALRIHTTMFPSTKKVRFILDDSPVGRLLQRQIPQELSRQPIPCAWEMYVADSWERYREIILDSNADPTVDALYPAALSLTDSRGNRYTPPLIIPWTATHVTKPELAINREFAKLGYFGGASVDFFHMGIQAGKIVVNILQGVQPGTIPIERAERFVLVFNLDRATQLGLTIPEEFLLAAEEIILRYPTPRSQGLEPLRGRE